MRYNFLIIHDIDNFEMTRRSHLDHLLFLERYAPDKYNFYYHYLREPVTDALRCINFHVIVLNTTALAFCRYYRPREVYQNFCNAWAFVSDLDAVKLAFPQDDYHQSNDIDALLASWGLDFIYTVRPEYGEMLYPRSRRLARLKGVYSGYVDDDSLQSMGRYRKPFDEREFDIVQRVTMHPFWGGRFSQIKGLMAKHFMECCENERSLRTSISTRPEDVLTGDDWMQLLGNGRFALGSEGGVSLWDPNGVYLDRTIAYLQRSPGASFAEVEAACFPGEDGKFVFDGFTPRLFEYAMMGCSPILTEGEYRGLLKPWEHYIPVKQDFSNVKDALEETKDWHAAQRRIRACRDALIANRALRYSALAREVMEDVDVLASSRCFRETNASTFWDAVERHRAEQKKLPPLAPIAGRLHAGSQGDILYALLQRVPLGVRTRIPGPIRKGLRRVLLPDQATCGGARRCNDD